MIKIPYGISNFERLISEGYYFDDTTHFIEKLEGLDTSYHFFMRPRRFGKTLFISMLSYYYGIEQQDKFESLFGKLYIGNRPTPKANAYHILHFEFSRIDTTSAEATFQGFLRNVRFGVERFMNDYPFFSEADKLHILDEDQPAGVIASLFTIFKKFKKAPIYLLIDEYDHFANEILAFHFQSFADMVSRNGFVRKFYEAIKTATSDNVVERLFVTGVTPITLDSLTSGFNIRTDLSRKLHFNEMMGFTTTTVEDILDKVCEGKNCDTEQMMADMKKWYNGYLFNEEAEHRIYNPNMVLFFADNFKQSGKYPQQIVDTNLASDYGKMRGLFHLGDADANFKVLEKLVKGESIQSVITPEFSFEKGFTQDDFVSLLYYMGFLSIESGELGGVRLNVPNYVIWQLYVDFFAHQVSKRFGFDLHLWNSREALLNLAQENKPQLLLDKLTETLKTLSTRDSTNFSEKHLKSIFIALVNMGNIFFIKSEPEVSKKFVDLLLLDRPPLFPNYQFAFELKYVRKKDADQAPAILAEAKEQLKGYLQNEELRGMGNLKAYVVVFVYDELFACDEVVG